MAGGKAERKDQQSQPLQRFQGIQFGKGEDMLKNPMIVQSIVRRAGIKRIDVVLEIGSGTGNLTVKLLEFVKRVIAVELDPRLVLEVQRCI